MQKWSYKVLGVMSGTSLDGVDLAVVHFHLHDKWSFEVLAAETLPYSAEWVRRLSGALQMDDLQLSALNESYTTLLSEIILKFKKMYPLHCQDLDAVCSHGHTIKHEPQNKFTLQIGNLPELAKSINEVLVCDFRVQDVKLGGQGAPLVPIGDELLFPEYDYCLNLGGFANISTQLKGKRLAYDICPVNTVLNFYSEKMGMPYDEGGKVAESGSLETALLQELNDLQYYKNKPPKSLGMEWVNSVVFPILKKYEISIPNILHTFCVHAAQQISKNLSENANSQVLVTGGGTFNRFLIKNISAGSKTSLVVPPKDIIEFKEAIIFGFLGVLRLRNEINVLKSVTGAVKDHSSGEIYFPS